MESYELLEKELAEWSGMPHVVACSSGTAALHLALESMTEKNRGAKVLVPDFTMIACPRAVSLAGMEPVFIDCGEDLNIDAHRVWSLVSEADKALNPYGSLYSTMAVHVYGRRCNMEPLAEAMSDCGSYLIEDLAEAHGVKPHPSTDAACWSFYKNKIIAGEEGGAVGFREEKLAARARQLRSLGFTDDHDFVHVPRGCNYRLSNANAELILKNFEVPQWVKESPLLAQYPIWGERVRDRRVAEKWYDDLCPEEYRMPPRDAPWVYDLRIPGMMPLRQTELVRALQAEGIAARHAFKPCHTQAEYRHCKVYGNGNAAVASREAIYLPLDPGKVTKESARKAFEVIRKVVM